MCMLWARVSTNHSFFADSSCTPSPDQRQTVVIAYCSTNKHVLFRD